MLREQDRIERNSLGMLGEFKDTVNEYTWISSTNGGSPSMSRYLKTCSDYDDIESRPVLENCIGTVSHDIGIASKCHDLQYDFDIVIRRSKVTDHIKYITIDGRSLDMQSEYSVNRVVITYDSAASDTNVAVKVRLVSTYRSEDREIKYHAWNMVLDVLRYVITCPYDFDMSVLNKEYRTLCGRYIFQRSNVCIYLCDDLSLSDNVHVITCDGMFSVLTILDNITSLYVMKSKRHIMLDLESSSAHKRSIENLCGINLEHEVTATVIFGYYKVSVDHKPSTFLCSELYIGNDEGISFIPGAGTEESFNIGHVTISKTHPIPSARCNSDTWREAVLSRNYKRRTVKLRLVRQHNRRHGSIMMSDSNDRPIRNVLDRYIVNNLIRVMKETAPMIIFIVDAPRPEYMKLLEYTTCVFMYETADWESENAGYDHDASYGTNHEVIVYGDMNRDILKSKVKAGEKVLIKAYISYSAHDSVSNVVQEITRYNVPNPLPLLIDIGKNMQRYSLDTIWKRNRLSINVLLCTDMREYTLFAHMLNHHKVYECCRTVLFSMFSERQCDYDGLGFIGSNVILDAMLALCEHEDIDSSVIPAGSTSSQIIMSLYGR